MCGIYGVCHASADFAEPLERMDSLLAHRGPDDHGVEFLPTGVLGSRRLSIIDLSKNARMPLWDVNRRACITFNGEIYNYRELRAECERAGAAFHSKSDTEVIVNQFLLHGEAAFDRLNGIFAFCLYAADSGEFFLVRDQMGVKPLYWSDTGHGLVFASELQALYASGAVEGQIAPEGLQAYLQLDYVPAPLTMLKGVYKLRQGHLLHIGADGARTVRPYRQPQERAAAHSNSWSHDVAEFDRLIHAAVERQLIADVPTGVLLSGGIDSSIVALAAREITGERIPTFSVGFDDPSFDETEYFELVARRIDSEQHTERLDSATLLELIPEVLDAFGEPVADGSIFPTFLLSRFARSKVKVALAGDGADELFAGYPTYRAASLAAPVAWLPGPLRRTLLAGAHAVLPVDFSNMSQDYLIKKFIAGLHRDPILRNARWLGTFLPEELPGLLVDFDPSMQVALEAMLHEPAATTDDPLEKLLRTDQRFYLQDQVLVKVDRASMANSLEVRVPFLDPDIVAFANSLPATRKRRGKDFKLILKRYAAGRLPENVISRPKKGFGVPLAKYFRGDLRELIGDVLSPDSLASHGLFHAPFVAVLLDQHWSGARDNRKQLFNLLTFCLWERRLHEKDSSCLTH